MVVREKGCLVAFILIIYAYLSQNKMWKMSQRFLFHLLKYKESGQIKVEIEEIHVVSARNDLSYLSCYIKIAVKLTFLWSFVYLVLINFNFFPDLSI